MKTHVELAIGTVQFGMRYGIVGRQDQISPNEVEAIFTRAYQSGIRMIDTAPVYGDIEQRLDSLTGDYPFRMISKIPALPATVEENEIAAWVTKRIRETRFNLCDRLSGLLFHRSADLLEKHGEILWQAASDALANSSIKLGVSCYSPAELNLLKTKFPIKIAQLPGNAFDQRVGSINNSDDIEIHLRSIFLQGVLLAPEKVVTHLPQASNVLDVWQAWCKERELTLLQAALGIAKTLPGVHYCVVGIDSLSQLDEILAAWEITNPLDGTLLATEDLNIIDPRLWTLNPPSGG